METARVLSTERAVTVEFLRNSGGFVVKANKGSKTPAKGWDPRKNNPASSAQALADIEFTDDNIGVHLHGNLVDVDVDGEDPNGYLTAALDICLPHTPHVWGRKSRPKTHRAYLLKETDFNPSNHGILSRVKRIPHVKTEVRGGPITRGEYSLMPSSVHPSGEVYTWHAAGEARSTPVVVSLEDILAGVREAGVVATLARYWMQGLRQELTMAMAGFLHRAKGIAVNLDSETPIIDLQDGLRILNTIMDVTADDPADRYAREKAFRMTWNKAEKGLPVTGATKIAELTDDENIVAHLYTLACDDVNTQAIDEFMQRFAIWQGPAVAIDMQMAEKGQQKPFMSRRNFASSFGDRFIIHNSKKVLLPELLWSMATATRVQGVTFTPGEPRIVSEHDGDKFNTWSGFKVPPHPDPVEASEVQPFLDYLKVVGNDNKEQTSWITHWMADMLKYPGDKCGTALVLVGLPGVGKSILGNHVLGKIIGPHHYSTSNSVDNVTRNFNAAYSAKLLIQCDEAINSKQLGVASRLKSLITDPYMQVEPKGVDPYTMPSHARFLFTSNREDDAISIGDGAFDRRYTVLLVPPVRRGDLVYWSELVTWLEANIAKVHRYLIDLEYDRAQVRRPMATEAKSRMQEGSWDMFDRWLLNMLARGFPLSEASHKNWWDAPRLNTVGKVLNRGTLIRDEWPEFVSTEALVKDYNALARSFNKPTLNEIQLGGRITQYKLRSGGATKRIKIDGFDERTMTKYTARTTLKQTPSPDRIKQYLRNKYGYEHEKEEYEDLADVLSQPSSDDF